MKEPPGFGGVSLDFTIYLRWVRTLEDYFEAKGCLDGREIHVLATKKL